MFTPLLSFIATLKTWKSCTVQPGSISSYAITLNGDGTYQLSQQDADKIDHRLWTALRHLTATQPSPRLVPILLLLTIEHWLGLYPTYPDAGDHRRYVITHFNSVTDDNPEQSTLTVTLSFASVQSVNMTEIVTGKHRATTSMSYAWFEAHFPGSIGRMKSARQLGMQGKEQAHYMVYGVALKDETCVLPNDLVACA